LTLLITGGMLVGSFFILLFLKRTVKDKDAIFDDNYSVFGISIPFSVIFGLAISIVITVINALLVLFLTFLTKKEGHYS
jgi:hypothetical protein